MHCLTLSGGASSPTPDTEPLRHKAGCDAVFFFSFYSIRIDSNKQSYSHRRDYGGSGDFISHSVYELSLNVLMIVKTVSEGGGCPEILDPLRNVSDILKIIIYLCTNLNIYD